MTLGEYYMLPQEKQNEIKTILVGQRADAYCLAKYNKPYVPLVNDIFELQSFDCLAKYGAWRDDLIFELSNMYDDAEAYVEKTILTGGSLKLSPELDRALDSQSRPRSACYKMRPAPRKPNCMQPKTKPNRRF